MNGIASRLMVSDDSGLGQVQSHRLPFEGKAVTVTVKTDHAAGVFDWNIAANFQDKEPSWLRACAGWVIQRSCSKAEAGPS
jgi:hypothetical protein